MHVRLAERCSTKRVPPAMPRGTRFCPFARNAAQQRKSLPLPRFEAERKPGICWQTPPSLDPVKACKTCHSAACRTQWYGRWRSQTQSIFAKANVAQGIENTDDLRGCYLSNH